MFVATSFFRLRRVFFGCDTVLSVGISFLSVATSLSLENDVEFVFFSPCVIIIAVRLQGVSAVRAALLRCSDVKA